VAGIAVKKTGQYLILIYAGWILIIIGAGLLTTLRADSSIAKAIGFQVVIGSGVGMVYVAIIFPILASIPVTQTAPATALYVFSRNFGYVSPLSDDFPSLPHSVTNDLPNLLDLGCHCRWCHHSERAKEKVTSLFPYAVPAGHRDSIRDDPDYSVAKSAVEGRCAEYFWYCAEGRLAGGAWHLDCGDALQHRDEAIKVTHGNR
jgi:hypothetical protein